MKLYFVVNPLFKGTKLELSRLWRRWPHRLSYLLKEGLDRLYHATTKIMKESALSLHPIQKNKEKVTG
jgi:hypothetical protein